jgi:hypothetical protein
MTPKCWLVGFACKCAVLIGAPQVAKGDQTSTKPRANQGAKANGIVLPTRVIIDQPHPTIATKPETPSRQVDAQGMSQHAQSSQEWYIAQRIIRGGIVANAKSEGTSSTTATTIKAADASAALKIEPL